jgi:hypothetical protein
MKALKHEMIMIEFTKKDLVDIIEREIFTKYPQLKNKSVWCWEDFFIAKDICNTTFADSNVAVNATFSKGDITLDDNKCCGVKCSSSEICR